MRPLRLLREPEGNSAHDFVSDTAQHVQDTKLIHLVADIKKVLSTVDALRNAQESTVRRAFGMRYSGN